MSEDAVRQTRSQKRALERDSHPSAPTTTTTTPTTPCPATPTTTPPEVDTKRARHEGGGESAGREERAERPERASRLRAEASATTGRSSATSSSSSTTLLSAEVKATIKVEVQTGEEPVDMSTNPKSEIKKEKRPPSPDDDVIILSDNESPSPQMNGHFKELDTDLLMKSSPEERERIIKQLKEELRLEEAKLVLLKRLRQSQMQKDTLPKAVGAGSVATPPPLVRGSFTAAKGSQQVLSGRSSGTVIPPPLVRGGQQVSKHGSQNSQIIMPPLVRGAPPISVSPQQLQSLRQQHQQHQHHHQHSGSGSGPPPLLLAPRASVPSGAPGHKLLQSGGLIRVANVPTTSLLVNIPQSSPTNMKSSMSAQSAGVGSIAGGNQADSPASRQAAAKLALRKQLEKTLLEIPPPKPPAPELNFLPSAANNEFIYLVGLEEVVQTLLDLGRAKQGLPVALATASAQEPYTCTQCQTDFTCRWRRDKGGAVLCEQCMSSNQKKALKAEHTSRLKAAFVKALQQEQEIEQRIMQQSAASSSPQTSSSSSSSSSTVHMVKAEHLVAQQLKQQRSSLQHQHQHISRASPSIGRHHATIKQSPGAGQLSRGGVQSSGVGVGVRGVTHSFSPSSQLQSAVAAAALVARPGKSASAGPASAGGRRHGSHGNHGNNAAAAAVWRKPSSAGSGVTMAYVNPSLSVHKTSSSAVERQREYLLDMLPSRSLSQTANTWK